MLARLALGLALIVGLTAPAPAEPAPASETSARKPKKERRKKHRSSKSSRKHRKKPKPEPAEVDDEPVLTEAPTRIEPAALEVSLVLGETAGFGDVPRPRPPIGGVVTVAPVVERPRGPRWFIGVRGGPSLIDRRGFYEFRSNRQTYHEERNARGELGFGRYLGRHVALGLAGGTGPYPKFDAPDPLLGENTRFSVYLYHARLDLDLHLGPFILGLGGGGIYEHTTGSFMTQDPNTLEVMTETATFKRFGAIGAARTGIQLTAGPVAFELIAEAAALRLARGTYVHSGVESPGPSDREKAFIGSVLLGLRLQ